MKVPFSAVLLLLTAAPASGHVELPPRETYAGSDACRACHGRMFDDWKHTFHSTVVQDARATPDAVLGDFADGRAPVPLADIEFTVGGHWTQRYLVRRGDDLFAAPGTWSVANHRWEVEDKWAWNKKPYRVYCVGCHSTRYDPSDGSSVEHAVGCEACHGPGRAHAESAGRAAIVNPAALPPDEGDLLCASCHVRGTDSTGTYRFPVGYVPGQRLEDHYVPAKLIDGESPRESFLRQFREWRARTERGDPPSCDVCGVTRPEPAGRPQEAGERCQACHQFALDDPSHTRHPAKVSLQCLDCHRPVPSGAGPSASVHSRAYFLVHREASYAVTTAATCQECHPDRPGEELLGEVRHWAEPHGQKD